MEHSFARRVDALDEIFGFIAERLTKLEVSPSHTFSVDLVVEELFTNMVKFHPESTKDISLRIDRQKCWLLVSLTDFDVDDFDITQVPEVDSSQPLSDRKRGGLGLHLVRRITESLAYRYEDRKSMVDLKIRIDP